MANLTNEHLSPFDIEQQESLLAILTYLEGKRLAGVLIWPGIPYHLFFGFDVLQAQALEDYLRRIWMGFGSITLINTGFTEEQLQALDAAMVLIDAGIGAVIDPYWANVTSLLTFQGAPDSTVFTDAKGKVWTTVGGAKIATDPLGYNGVSGLLDGSGDYIATPHHEDYNFAGGDFTLEGVIAVTAIGSDRAILDKKDGSTSHTPFAVWLTAAGQLRAIFSTSGSSWTSEIISTETFDVGVPTHWAVSRERDVVRIFLGGQVEGTAALTGSLFNPVSTLSVGSWDAPSFELPARLHALRITKGVARYNGNFTPPPIPFPVIGPT